MICGSHISSCCVGRCFLFVFVECLDRARSSWTNKSPWWWRRQHSVHTHVLVWRWCRELEEGFVPTPTNKQLHCRCCWRNIEISAYIAAAALNKSNASPFFLSLPTAGEHKNPGPVYNIHTPSSIPHLQSSSSSLKREIDGKREEKKKFYIEISVLGKKRRHKPSRTKTHSSFTFFPSHYSLCCCAVV